MVKVRIMIEQDGPGGETPVSWTFEHNMGGTGSNPRFVGDAMQLALVRAATDACRHMAKLVDRRGGDVFRAAEDLLAVVGQHRGRRMTQPTCPREPTPDECTRHDAIPYEVDGQIRAAWACWYPQMGGYHGKAVAVPGTEGCVDVYVWHDGEFPFAGDDRGPVRLHHCDPDQFVGFGQFLASIEADA